MADESDFTPVPGVDPEPEEVCEMRDPASLVSLMQPLRDRLLLRLIKAPGTAADLAETVGAPVTRIYYHLGLLEEHGAIRVVATRRVRGVDERLYRAVARSYRLAPEVLEESREHPEQLDEVVEAMFASARAQLRGVGARVAREDEDRVVLAHTHMELPTARRPEFIRRLKDLIEEYGDLDADAEEPVEHYGVLVAAYPVRPVV